MFFSYLWPKWWDRLPSTSTPYDAVARKPIDGEDEAERAAFARNALRIWMDEEAQA